MQRKFKHKITGDVVKERHNKDCRFYTNEIHSIPALFVENSNDWQEIPEIPVGTKVVDTNPETKGYTYEKLPDGNWKIGSMDFITIDENFIGKNKRFQIVEEVKKDYEILKFYETSPKEDRIYNVLEDGNLLWDIPEYKGAKTNPGATHWTEASKKGYLIYQVKRSDGEVFQIGDSVQLISGNWQGNDCKISGITIVNNNVVFRIKQCEIESSYSQGINNWRKAKPILFTTEDGKDIREGDKYFRVISNWTIQQENAIKLGEHIYKADNILRFSTKEAAQNWIIYNKPCLSINDLIKHPEIKIKAVDVPRLRELVKSKL